MLAKRFPYAVYFQQDGKSRSVRGFSVKADYGPNNEHQATGRDPADHASCTGGIPFAVLADPQPYDAMDGISF